MNDIDFELTKTGKSKNVSFAAGAKKGNSKAAGNMALAEVSQGHVREGVDDIR